VLADCEEVSQYQLVLCDEISELDTDYIDIQYSPSTTSHLHARVDLLMIEYLPKKGMALVSLVSIYPYKCFSNTLKQTGPFTRR